MSQEPEFPALRTVGELRSYLSGRPDSELVAVEVVRGRIEFARSFAVRHLKLDAIDRTVTIVRAYLR